MENRPAPQHRYYNLMGQVADRLLVSTPRVRQAEQLLEDAQERVELARRRLEEAKARKALDPPSADDPIDRNDSA